MALFEKSAYSFKFVINCKLRQFTKYDTEANSAISIRKSLFSGDVISRVNMKSNRIKAIE